MSHDVQSDRDRAAQSTKVDDRGDIDWGLHFESGSVLGDRYQIRGLLGCGGMGEVWHAFDLKLRVEVALKGLRPELLADEERCESLRSEVRAAREVVSPNVCRVFDLIEIDGQELVSMEFVGGTTLLEVMREDAPFEPSRAQEMAFQFLAGLEAIHRAGLVHRDVKPENIMVTRTGRVVLTDFGLARQVSEGSGTVSGTRAYMAPEQAKGEVADSRSDIFSAGVVLAEMVSPAGVKDLESRRSLWEGLREEPAQVADVPWSRIILRAVASEPADRYDSALDLSRALEEVVYRVRDEEGLDPYPGLSAFGGDDAEFFFGREVEVEAVWKKLRTTQMIGIIGASGSGKSSFIGAGVVPSKPKGWKILVCSPGKQATASLRQALVPEIEDNEEAVKELAAGGGATITEAFSIVRRRFDEVLLVVDQFEELFTQNGPEERDRFVGLLGKLALTADIHLLISMRDDYLIRCNRYDELRPVFSELTALDPPHGSALRRAVVQPALSCGYRFEDEELADEILAEVEGERGALPLLAFALSQLWEMRDRDQGLITRQIYRDIGGVGGALARHAEATIDRIGVDRIAIVREIFRNLVTADGTRAVREWNELLSVFRDSRSESPAAVLSALIDARLLTSYEVHEDDDEPTRRVEIIHESLLANWPRLVRWQTQDADAAQLRDQLRQAARTWDEHDRSDDLLWTGSAYREFAVWREGYPGGLTEVERAFGSAMTRYAELRKRRRRAAVAGTFAALLVVMAVIGGFWRRSVTEARRAEAANLSLLAQLRLEDHPTATIAYAIASLELADSPEVRRLALDALWRGPTELRLPIGSPYSLDFSPDGRWLATANDDDGVKLWPADGGPATALEPAETTGEGRISPRGDLIAYNSADMNEIRLWSFPAGRLLRSLQLRGTYNQLFWFSRDGKRLITSTENLEGDELEVMIRSWRLAGGEPGLLARLDVPKESGGTFFGVDPTESLLAWVEGSRFNISSLENTTGPPVPSISLEHDRVLTMAAFDDEGRKLATADTSGTITIWSLDRDPPELVRSFTGAGTQYPFSLRFDASGTMFGTAGGYLGNMSAPPDAEPLMLKHSGSLLAGVAFHPESTWYATGNSDSVSLWPLARPYPMVIRGHEEDVNHVQFTPDGNWIVSTSDDGTVRLWPLRSGSGQRSRILYQAQGAWEAPVGFAMAPDGSFVAIGTSNGTVWVLSLDGSPSRELTGIDDVVRTVAVDSQSRLVAGGAGFITEESVVRVWDLVTGETRALDAGDGEPIQHLEFTDNGGLWAASGQTLRRWGFAGSEPRILEEIDLEKPQVLGNALQNLVTDDRLVLLRNADRLRIQDLETHDSRDLGSHGSVRGGGLDSTGTIVVSIDAPGGVQVGLVTGDEPHLLLGHDPEVYAVAISPNGRWIATGGDDKTIRLWPIPDLSKPPLHTLPRDELIAKLQSLTNLRVVRDEESPSGWKLKIGPFPGWKTVPTW